MMPPIFRKWGGETVCRIPLHSRPPVKATNRNEGLPPLFGFLKRKPMLAALNSLDGVPAAAEALALTQVSARVVADF